MRPLAEMSDDEAARVGALLFDLDDTLLTHGVLTRAAYDALWDLHDAGLDLAAVTGRPAAWGDVVARQWPVLGVVAENGAVLVWREGERGAIVRSLRGAPLDQGRRAQVIAAVRAEVPEIDITDDNGARLTDVTFDVGERVRLPPDGIARARRAVERCGARAIVSSVHLHATFEGDDKASGALRLLYERRGLDPVVACRRAAFVGDSENDAACFSAFETTVGVANVAPWIPRLSIPPRFITKATMGDGFVELARRLRAARS